MKSDPHTQRAGRFSKLRDELIAQQDQYCAVIKEARSVGDTEDAVHKLQQIGWSGLLDSMQKELYPPAHQDRDLWSTTSDSRSLLRVHLDQLNDQDLAGHIYHLNEIRDHTFRLRALARFCRLVGSQEGNPGTVFVVWSLWSRLRCIQSEMRQRGLSDQESSLEQYAAATSAIGRLIIETIDEDWSASTFHSTISEMQELAGDQEGP